MFILWCFNDFLLYFGWLICELGGCCLKFESWCGILFSWVFLLSLWMFRWFNYLLIVMVVSIHVCIGGEFIFVCVCVLISKVWGWIGFSLVQMIVWWIYINNAETVHVSGCNQNVKTLCCFLRLEDRTEFSLGIFRVFLI